MSRSSSLARPAWLAALLLLGARVAAQEIPPGKDWDITVGAGAFVASRYLGSDDYRLTPFPMVQVTFRNRIYLGHSGSGAGVGLGAFLIRAPRLDLMAELGVGGDRPASRADSLAGMDDRDLVLAAGAALNYRLGPIELAVGGAQGLNDGGGFLGTTRASFARRFGRLIAGLGVSATFADSRQMRREFGITESEARRRQTLVETGDERLRPGDGGVYVPAGGQRNAGTSLSLFYLMSPKWSVIGFAGVDWLSDEAAASPIVRSREQYSGGVGLGFRF